MEVKQNDTAKGQKFHILGALMGPGIELCLYDELVYHDDGLTLSEHSISVDLDQWECTTLSEIYE